RLVIVGSDKIYMSIFRKWQKIHGADKVQWVAAYGTTETTVTSTIYHDAWLDDLSHESIMPIGKPMPGVDLHVLDEAGKPVPHGEGGELGIGGPGVARGYCNMPEKTAESFVIGPFEYSGAPRLYKTGDLVAQRPDDTYVLKGRRDAQIKINGLRIEPGEIES